MHHPTAHHVLSAYGLGGASLVPVTMGHINQTFRVDAAKERYTLQRLNPIFDPKVNLDIEALTLHLGRAGLVTPTLVRDRTGHAWVQGDDGGIWRLLTYVPGEVFHFAAGPGLCYGAGALLGRFHRALAPVEHTFAATRLGVHDTARHLTGLASAIQGCGDHAARDQVERLAEAVTTALAALPTLAELPQRIVHGDAKLSNIVFVEAELGAASTTTREGRALIDLDTLAHMEVHLELGDALRSWCNPVGEGPGGAHFLPAYLRAACRGYAAGAEGLLGDDEVMAIAPGIATITLELCARFLRDALEERYFSWDRDLYQHAWQHHLVRARSQWACFQSLVALGGEPTDIVAHAFGLTGSKRGDTPRLPR